MKSVVMSEGKLFRNSALFAGVLLLLISVGCASGQKSQSASSNPANLADQLDEEVSLKSDRDKFVELRKDIPEKQQVNNDELAMDLELLAKVDKKPSRIRSQFQRQVSKLRNNFRKKSKRIRTDFRDVQKKQRDTFLKSLKMQREQFYSRKPDRDKSKEFYAKQDVERKDFFADQKDQRKEFDAKMRQKSKDFNANMRERIRQFEEQLRLYKKNFTAKQKEEREAKREAQRAAREQKGPKVPQNGYFKTDPHLEKETQKIMQEFDEMKSKPGSDLKSGE
jgi:outer membrane murein-binding lipoprotein Lpp